MAKSEKPKPKLKAKPKPKFTDKAQSERFVEAARKLGIEETDEKFEKAIKTLLPSAKERQS
jgi:hypothetical protein